MKTNELKNDFLEVQEEKNICDSLFEYVKFLFNKDIKAEQRFNIHSIYEYIKTTFKSVRDDHSNLMLALQSAALVRENNYIYAHSVRTTIIAMIIGKYLKLPTHKLIELGVAALLHDIGMISIPEEIYLSSRTLTDEERKIIRNHPVYGYKILDTYNFSPAVKMAALEHHEREDGSGYPQKLPKEKISLYGRIIAVACSFEAISAKRIYKESVDPHSGIIKILKNKVQYYDEAVQALVNALSIYPIGLYVLLSDGKRGLVVDVNMYDPRYPILQLLDERAFNGKSIVRYTFSDGLHIVRPLQKSEM